MSLYAQHVSAPIPQSEPLPGQVKNSAGGHSYEASKWSRLDRFLILGSEGGSYYASERKLAIENATCVRECFDEDPVRTINRIVEVSVKGLAPKNDPAVFALAMLSKSQLALSAVSSVCRIPTHLFQFIQDAKQFRGWGRSLRRVISSWYNEQNPRRLAHSMVKYKERNGFSHKRAVDTSHPRPASTEHSALYQWASRTGKVSAEEKADLVASCPQPVPIVHEIAKKFESGSRSEFVSFVVNAIGEHGLTREMLPTEALNSVEIWDALLDRMPVTAMIRNLGKMTSIGLIKPLSDAAQNVVSVLEDPEALKAARVHPIQVLMAMSTYSAGRGVKGGLSWTPDMMVVNAMESAFYKSFSAVEPTGKKHFLGLDVSGSMCCGSVAGTFMTPRQAAAAMAMVAVRTEPQVYSGAFCDKFREFPISKNESLLSLVERTSRMSFGATDCSLPMLAAYNENIDVDVFCIYTDSETWCGQIHPSKALERYRQKVGHDAKLIVVGMVANKFTIADPNDPSQLDVVGFSADVPQVMRAFITGGV